jgi:amino acid transporter
MAPTYLYIVVMLAIIGWGMVQTLTGTLPPFQAPPDWVETWNSTGQALGLFIVLRAFSQGAVALTGVEAISDGVPAFKPPEWRNARTTLTWAAIVFAALFLGIAYLVTAIGIVPDPTEEQTVLSLLVRHLTGDGAVLVIAQVATVLILVLAANTSFADFPRLANFQAGDDFLPRQLTKRGHRLVFSNGIIFLSIAAIALVIVTGAKVDRLIPLYAIGVFTSFTLSQAGMARHHLREREPGWRKGLVVNGIGAFLSLVVDVVIAITKFTHGAWVVVVFVPVLVVFLVRLARQYELEAEQLEHDVPAAVAAPIMRRSARPRGRAGHPVRPGGDARRAAGGALRARPARSRPAGRGVAGPRHVERRARPRRVPGPAHHEGRGRGRGP